MLAALHRERPRDTGVALDLALALREFGDFEQADILFVRILEAEPYNWPALKGRASLAEARGDLEKAIALLEGGSTSEGDDADRMD